VLDTDLPSQVIESDSFGVETGRFSSPAMGAGLTALRLRVRSRADLSHTAGQRGSRAQRQHKAARMMGGEPESPAWRHDHFLPERDFGVVGQDGQSWEAL
jgi:hypothetical protein